MTRPVIAVSEARVTMSLQLFEQVTSVEKVIGEEHE